MNTIRDTFGRCAFRECRADLEFDEPHKPCCPHATPATTARPTVRAPYAHAYGYDSTPRPKQRPSTPEWSFGVRS